MKSGNALAQAVSASGWPSDTVPFHEGRDLSPILLRQIAKDVGLAVEDLLRHR